MLHNQFPVATYLNSPDYYSGGAGALVPAGSLMPSAGYRPYSPYYPAGGLGNYMGSAYQHPYSHMSQHPYSYGYGGYGGYGSYGGLYGGMNGGLGMQPYYGTQTMMPHMGYQRGYY